MDKTPKTLQEWLQQMYGKEATFKSNRLAPMLFKKLLGCQFTFDEYTAAYRALAIKTQDNGSYEEAIPDVD